MLSVKSYLNSLAMHNNSPFRMLQLIDDSLPWNHSGILRPFSTAIVCYQTTFSSSFSSGLAESILWPFVSGLVQQENTTFTTITTTITIDFHDHTSFPSHRRHWKIYSPTIAEYRHKVASIECERGKLKQGKFKTRTAMERKAT